MPKENAKKLSKIFLILLTFTILTILQVLFFGAIILILTYDNPNIYSLYPKMLAKGILPIIVSIFLTSISLKITSIILKTIFILIAIFLFCFVLFWGLGFIAILSRA